MTGDGAIVTDNSRFAANPAHIASRSLKAILHAELAGLGSHLFPFRHNGGGVRRMKRAGPTLAKAFLQRQAGDGLPARIGVKAVAGDIGFNDSDRREVAQRPKALFAGPELLVRRGEFGRALA